MQEHYIGGIPDQLFSLSGRGTVIGKSGQEISYIITDSRIEFDQGNFCCYAFVEDGYFRLVLKTLERNNSNGDSSIQRSTDLFAKQFAIRAYRTLSKRHKIRGFKAVWEISSDNYGRFIMAVNGGKTQEQAGRITWSGNLATELGFTSKTDAHFDPIDEYIEVIFS